MSAIPSSPRVKLRTTSRRVPRERAASVAVDDSPEPTMRLSRAIMVMLLLHIVAVGGFLASSVLKDKDLKRSPSDSNAALEAEDSHVPIKGDASEARKLPGTATIHPGVHVVRPGETLTLIANENGVTLEALVAANGAETVTNGLRAGQELKLPIKSPDPSTSLVDNTTTALNQIEGHTRAAGTPPVSNPLATNKSKPVQSETSKVYVVAKGENAYTIAQKNKVNYETLLKLNQIDDPKKIRPGQKLRLPPAPTRAKPKQT